MLHLTQKCDIACRRYDIQRKNALSRKQKTCIIIIIAIFRIMIWSFWTRRYTHIHILHIEMGHIAHFKEL